jgi:hypothetical protein
VRRAALNRSRSGGSSSYAWEEITLAAAWEPRDGAGLVHFDGALWILGGWDGATVANWDNRSTTNQVWSSADGVTWTEELAHVTSPVQTGAGAMWIKRHSAGWLKHAHAGTSYVYVIGGDHLSPAYNEFGIGASNGYQCDVWRSSDPSNVNGWSRVAESDNVGWTGRMLAVCASHGGNLYVMGGQDGLLGGPPYPFSSAMTATFYNDVWRSTDGGATWSQITASAGWSARGITNRAPSWLGRIWLVGGGQYETAAPVDVNPRTYENEVWSSADGVTWTQHANAPWAARQYHNVEVFDGKLWVMGGYDAGGNPGGNRRDVWWTANGEDWTYHGEAPWYYCHASGTCAVESGPMRGLWHATGNGSLLDGVESVHVLRAQ